MTVAMDQRAMRQSGEREILGALFEKFAEQENLLRERLRTFVFRKKICEFIAEDGGATRFQHNDGRCRFDFRKQLVHDLEQQTFGAVEHADVVKRTPAAKMRARDGYIEASSF